MKVWGRDSIDTDGFRAAPGPSVGHLGWGKDWSNSGVVTTLPLPSSHLQSLGARVLHVRVVLVLSGVPRS